MDIDLRMSKPGQTKFDQGGQAKAMSRAVVDGATYAASMEASLYHNCNGSNVITKERYTLIEQKWYMHRLVDGNPSVSLSADSSLCTREPP